MDSTVGVYRVGSQSESSVVGTCDLKCRLEIHLNKGYVKKWVAVTVLIRFFKVISSLVISFLRFGDKTKREVEFRDSKCTASRFQWNVRNEVSWHYVPSAYPPFEGYSVKLKKNIITLITRKSAQCLEIWMEIEEQNVSSYVKIKSSLVAITVKCQQYGIKWLHTILL